MEIFCSSRPMTKRYHFAPKKQPKLHHCCIDLTGASFITLMVSSFIMLRLTHHYLLFDTFLPSLTILFSLLLFFVFQSSPPRRGEREGKIQYNKRDFSKKTSVRFPLSPSLFLGILERENIFWLFGHEHAGGKNTPT